MTPQPLPDANADKVTRIKLSKLPLGELRLLSTAAKKSAEMPCRLLESRVHHLDGLIHIAIVSHDAAKHIEQYFMDAPACLTLLREKEGYVCRPVRVLRRAGDVASFVYLKDAPMLKAVFAV